MNNAQLVLTEQIMLTMLKGVGPQTVMVALNNVTSNPTVFTEAGLKLDDNDARTALWFKGLDTARIALTQMYANSDAPPFYINVSVNDEGRAAGVVKPVKRQFHNMHDAVAFVRNECHANRPPHKIVVYVSGVENEIALSNFV